MNPLAFLIVVIIPLIIIGGIAWFVGCVKRGGMDLKGPNRYPWE